MTFSFQPVTVTTHDGTIHEPARAEIIDGELTVYDRDGNVMAEAKMIDGDRVTGRRRRVVETTEGRWIIEDICGCSSTKRALISYWKHRAGAELPET